MIYLIAIAYICYLADESKELEGYQYGNKKLRQNS